MASGQNSNSELGGRKTHVCICEECYNPITGTYAKQTAVTRRRHMEVDVLRRMQNAGQQSLPTNSIEIGSINPRFVVQPFAISEANRGPRAESMWERGMGGDAPGNSFEGVMDVSLEPRTDEAVSAHSDTAPENEHEHLLSSIVPINLRNPTFKLTVAEDWEPTGSQVDVADDLWYLVVIVIVWLNLAFGLSRRGCELLASVLRRLLEVYAGHDTRGKYVSMKTMYKRLGLEGQVFPLPLCATCGTPHSHGIPFDSLCRHCSLPLFDLHSGTASAATPKSIFPVTSLSAQLETMLADVYFEDAVDAWRTREHPDDGLLSCIQDGRMWNTVPAPDGSLFFDNREDRLHADELRLALLLQADGFSAVYSQFAQNHSAHAISLTIANLPVHEKYRTFNTILYGIYPGPRAPDFDMNHRLMEPLTDELIMLYESGQVMSTARYPDGRRVRVILLAVCCDHPQLCREGGFTDHRSRNFCSRCTVQRDQLSSFASLNNQFPKRDGEEHRRQGFQHKSLSGQAKVDFALSHGTRYSALHRLRYFNCVTMIVMDPMHNFLLGIVKDLWLNLWIRHGSLRRDTDSQTRELGLLQRYLKEIECPRMVGRLPRDLGQPSAGSLTADEYRVLAVVLLPLVLPFVWEEFAPFADGSELSMRNPCMDLEDPFDFLCLAAALKLILARTIHIEQLPRATTLLSSFLTSFSRRHPNHVKPNHHWAVHIFDQILDYGPVYGFWTFSSERLNKVLKETNSSHHAGGSLELTFVNAFVRQKKLRQLLRRYESDDSMDVFHICRRDISTLLLQSTQDDRGLIASVAREVDEACNEALQFSSFGSSVTSAIDGELQRHLLLFYHSKYPEDNVFGVTSIVPAHISHPCFLSSRATFYRRAVVGGRRLRASDNIDRAPDSVIQYIHSGLVYVGQVHSLFSHEQPLWNGATVKHVLVRVKWFRPLRSGLIDTSNWDQYPELEVRFHEFNNYLDPETEGPPCIIDASDIGSMACREKLLWSGLPLHTGDNRRDPVAFWATVGLTKDYSSL